MRKPILRRKGALILETSAEKQLKSLPIPLPLQE
jgi:hypothetical protein